MGRLLRRHGCAIAFTLVVVAGFLGFRRVEDINARTRQLAIRNRELTIQLEATVQQRRLEICSAEITTRVAVRDLLLSLSDFLGPVRALELEQRVHAVLDPPPGNCPP